MGSLREWRGAFGFPQVVALIAFAMSAYHLSVGYLGEPPAEFHRPLHVLFALAVLFLGSERAGRRLQRMGRLLWDALLAIALLLSTGYLIVNSVYISERMIYVTPLTIQEWIYGPLLVLVILEAARRTVGWVLTILGAVFLVYAHFGYLLPPPFWHGGYSIAQIVEHMYLTTEGIWGTPVAVTASYIFLFVLYGSFLLASGAGDFFTNLARALTGRSVGGPAKTAVVSSAFMGMLSGSSAANVVTTGSFTIPAMRRAGYSADFAAGVEAVASTGGQITPPILGSAAFIMMEFIGIDYVTVMKVSIIPAILYYVAVFAMVHLEARRTGLAPVADPGAPTVRAILRKRGYLVLSVFAMLYYLFEGYTPAMAAFWAILSLIVLLVVFDPENRRRIHRVFWEAMTTAPRLIAPVTVAVAVGGMIVGVITLTGLGERMSIIVLALAGGNMLLTLVFTMVMAVILGMGMPTSGAYIVLATLLAPALVEMGVPLIAAHMYIIFCASMSSITPPVAIASYAAAAVANSDPWKTGLTAVRLGLSVFIIPYMFVFGPQLLTLGSWGQILYAFCTASFGIFLLSLAAIGWFKVHLTVLERGLALAAALCLMFVGWRTDLLGVGLVVALLGLVYFRTGFRPEEPKPVAPDGDQRFTGDKKTAARAAQNLGGG